MLTRIWHTPNTGLKRWLPSADLAKRVEEEARKLSPLLISIQSSTGMIRPYLCPDQA
ncbi:hypothetical protein BDV95DRAFT_575790 [Massariosphaeria phaeospora]|uniref:Uncharacterized protein n=1 Tax=Massariosphaeria phaeospora TaxID=100035 RepID=A0A7C8MD99_9PLEO|nr:hypothetical protein BDV95DRAFT_575790 [Massariosphaeria phaeospora]